MSPLWKGQKTPPPPPNTPPDKTIDYILWGLAIGLTLLGIALAWGIG